MGLGILEALIAEGHWIYAVLLLALVLIIVTVGRIVMLREACRGVDSKDKAAIIKALAEVFKTGWFR